MSELDWARKLFGSKGGSVSNSASSRIQNQGDVTIGHSSTRYGTVQAIGDNGLLTVLLDGSDSPIYGYCETPVAVGQRVSVVFDNGTVTIVALTYFVDSVTDEFTNVRQEIEDKGQEIIDSVKDEIGDVEQAAQDAVNAANEAIEGANQAAQEANQAALEASQAASSIDDIKTTVNGLESDMDELSTSMTATVETANSALTQATAAKQDIDGFKTTVSQTYETKADADAAIAKEVLERNTAITQSANSIKQEVSQNYVNNETGANLATKTEVEAAIDGVTSTVSQNYVNKNDASKTYATKTEVKQTEDAILLSVSDSYQVKGDYATGKDVTDAIAEEVVNRNAAIDTKANQITTSVSQNYQSKTDAGKMEQDLEAQIKVTSDAITQEVADRKTAVNGAVSESKTYTDTTAKGLTTSITQSVMNEVGETYTKKADFELTVDGMTQTFTQSISDVDSKATAAQSTANTAKSTADSASKTASTAKSTADSASKTASTASTNASSALSTANTAKSTADTASMNATSAQSTANAAKTTADSASKTATTANNTANTAKSTADTASSNASKAQTAASNAQSTANTAKTTADKAQSTATTANNTANTAKSTADAAKKTADAVNKTVSTVITNNADGVTVGRSDLANSARVSSEAEFQILNGTTKITTIGRNEIHLAKNVSDIETAKIFLLNDIFQINTVPANLKYTDNYYDLTIQPTDLNPNTTSAASVSLKLEDNAYISVRESIPGVASSTPTVEIVAENINLRGDGGVSIYPEGPTSIQGDTFRPQTASILKPACSIGARGVKVQMKNVNTIFAANYQYGVGDSKKNTSFTSIYRSGNYIFVDIPKRYASSDNNMATYVPIEVSAQVTTQDVNNSNVAAEIKIEHVSGNAGALTVDTVASPIQYGSSFVPVYIVPTVVQLPRGAYNAANAYDRYRIYLHGRCSNASANLTNWILTVKML
ncbi:hypothetical protein H7U34_01805 [Collinsella tanakaei]|nr:hypothetical protein [Collinsella tanakaei]